jgi:hypothetical protein
MAVPHNPAAVIANRREVITRRLLYRPLEPCSRKARVTLTLWYKDDH